MNLVSLLAFLSDVLATFVCQAAYVLQKRALIANENDGLNGGKRESPFCSKTYLMGFALLFIGSVWHIVVLPFCDIVLL